MGTEYDYYDQRIESLQQQHKEALRRLAEVEAGRDEYKAQYLSRQESYVIACEALKAENTKLVRDANLAHYQLAVALGWQPFPYLMPGEPSGEQLWCPPGERVHISTAVKLSMVEIVRQVAELRKCVELYADKRKWIPIALEGEGVVYEFWGHYKPAQECLAKRKGGEHKSTPAERAMPQGLGQETEWERKGHKHTPEQ